MKKLLLILLLISKVGFAQEVETIRLNHTTRINLFPDRDAEKRSLISAFISPSAALSSYKNPGEDNFTPGRCVLLLWNNTLSDYDSLFLKDFTYSASGSLLQVFWKQYTPGGWRDYFSTSVTVDSTSSVVERLNRQWNGTSMVNTHLFHYHWNAQGDIDSAIWSVWDSVSSGWAIAENWRFNLMYDSFGNMIDYVSQFYSGSVSDWVNYEHQTWIYEPSGNLSIWHLEEWIGGIWQNMEESEYVYDSLGVIVSVISRTFPASGFSHTSRLTNLDWHNVLKGQLNFALEQSLESGLWKDVAKHTYNWGANESCDVLTDLYDGIKWVPYEWRISEIDNYGWQTERTNMVWKSSFWELGSSELEDVVYSASAQPAEVVFSVWHPTDHVYLRNSKEIYSDYIPFVGIAPMKTPDSFFLVYPNPSEGQLLINSKKYAHALLKLYDLKGELLASDILSAGVNELDYSILPAGTYNYSIQVQGAEVQCGKWVKID